MALIDRAQRIITAPAAEWPLIATEPTPPGPLYSNYIVPLALITPVCTFLSIVLFSHRAVFLGAVIAIASFVLELVNVAIIALIAEALVPSFNGVKDRSAAFKWIGYSYTPRWVAGFAMLVPIAGPVISLIGAVYALYVLYLGAVPMMRVAPDKAAGYTIVVIVAAIVLFILVALVIGILFTLLAAGAIMSAGGLH